MFNCINKNSIIIDVRDQKEHLSSDISILKNSINIPVNQLEKNMKHMKIDKNTPIIVFCKSGKRSKVASIILNDLGYTNVLDIGSYLNLNLLGL